MSTLPSGMRGAHRPPRSLQLPPLPKKADGGVDSRTPLPGRPAPSRRQVRSPWTGQSRRLAPPPGGGAPFRGELASSDPGHPLSQWSNRPGLGNSRRGTSAGSIRHGLPRRRLLPRRPTSPKWRQTLRHSSPARRLPNRPPPRPHLMQRPSRAETRRALSPVTRRRRTLAWTRPGSSEPASATSRSASQPLRHPPPHGDGATGGSGGSTVTAPRLAEAAPRPGILTSSSDSSSAPAGTSTESAWNPAVWCSPSTSEAPMEFHPRRPSSESLPCRAVTS